MDGIILIDKEKGINSRDVVNNIVKILNTKKVGHTGTLDPLATGVLVVCVGRATKLVNYLTAKDKEYIASVSLGLLTDTLDITGNVIKEENVNITTEEIEVAIKKMIKTYMQQVPIYSAVKVNGKKLYEYARENINISLPEKEVTIYDMELISDVKKDNNRLNFIIKCKVSKGTYIRSLIRDLAASLNTIGIMTALRRTKQGEFSIDDCINLSKVSKEKIIPVTDVLSNFDKIVVDELLKKDILNGKIIDNNYNKEKVLFIDQNSKALAIYKCYDKDISKLKPEIMLGGI